MALDPSIALAVRPPVLPPLEIQTPLEQFGKVLSLRALMQQGQLRGMELEQMKRSMASTEAMNRILAGENPSPPATVTPQPATPVPTVTPGMLAGTPGRLMMGTDTAGNNVHSVDGGKSWVNSDTGAGVAGQIYGATDIGGGPPAPGAAPQALTGTLLRPMWGAPLTTPTTSVTTAPMVAAPVTAPTPSAPLTTPTAPAPAIAPAVTPVQPAPQDPVERLTALTGQLLKAGGVNALPLIENLNKLRKAQLDARISQLDAGKKETAAAADLAAGVIDEDTLQRNLAKAHDKGLITTDEWRHYSGLGFDNPATQTWLKSVQNQALGADKVQDMRIKAAQEARAQLEFGPKYTKAAAEATEDQMEGDAKILSAAARISPAALEDARGKIGPDRAAPFAGLTTPDDLMGMGQKAHEYVTAVEAKRHNLSQEELANVNAAIRAGRLRETRRVNDVEYGPGQKEFWVDQLYQHPDSIGEVPAKLKGAVGVAFKDKYGLPLPVALPQEAKNTERASQNALDSITWIRNALKNPEIQQRIGPILGRLGEAEQDVGATANLSPEAAKLAQELRTRMRYFVFQEGKSVMGGRMPQNLMKALESSSANVQMEPNTLEGALSGAEGAARDQLENIEKQRFGGKARPPEARGLQPAPVAPPKAGDTRPAKDGKTYRFKGGDPNVKSNWEPV